MRSKILVLASLALLAGCATSQPDADLNRALAGESQVSGNALDRRIAAAARNPLGAQNNPVRAEMPMGQRAYLDRLRCSDGRAPQYDRVGNFGVGVYGNIVDGYSVDCGPAQPGQVQVFMDMYHRGYIEDRPVPGFTIIPRGTGK